MFFKYKPIAPVSTGNPALVQENVSLFIKINSE
jgi:hypothetical protein